MSDTPEGKDAAAGRRAFVKRLVATAAVAPPAFMMLGASAAEARQVPFQRARGILRRTRELSERAKVMERVEDRRKVLTELQAMEREARSIAEKLPKMEMERLTTELRELKTNITELKRKTPGRQ